ncbi:MAG: carboxypeptidase-like regulatory domain-containing protein [Chloroflexi bacterium]|nr:carboxypeptidase-like regulatory domain-containing protein [Chloroflexota bacterium]
MKRTIGQGRLERAKVVLYLLFAFLLAFGSFSPPEALAVGTVSGKVYGPDGVTPVQNARVELGSPMHMWKTSVVTGVAGEFTFAFVPAGEYFIEAFPPSGSAYAASSPKEVTVDSSPVNVNLTLAAISISGTVVEPNGSTPVPMSLISVRRPGGSFQTGTMADQIGVFRIGGLVTGTYVLTAYPPLGDSPFSASEPISVEIAGISDSHNLGNVPLTLPSITGLVVGPDPDSRPIPMAEVVVRNADLSVAKDTMTRMDGTFSFGGLGAGTFTITVRSPWGMAGLEPPAPRSVTVTVGHTTNAGVFQFNASRRYIVGNVINRDGGPVTSALVVATRMDGSGFASSPVTTTRPYSYGLQVRPGTWMVTIVPDRSPGAPPPDWIYGQPPIPVSFESSPMMPITKVVNITVTAANASVSGRLVKPDSSTFEPRSAFVSAYNERGFVNGSEVAPDGGFRIPLKDGVYRLVIELRDESLIAPSGIIVTLTPGQQENLGDILLGGRTSRINGQVVDGNGQGVPDIRVRAWRRDGHDEMEMASAKTITGGLFSLQVISGTWEVSPVPDRDSQYIVPEPPVLVSVTDNETKTIELHVLLADATIRGRVIDERSGEIAEDLEGYASALQGNKTVSGAPIDDGLFTIHVPSGFYTVTAHFPPGSGVTLKNNVTVSLGSGETQVVTLTVTVDSATIRGQLKNLNDKPQTGVNASVFARNGEDGREFTRVNPVDASYAMSVTAGTWYMHAATDPGSNFVVRPRFNNSVSVPANGTATFDFDVVQYSTVLSGTVVGPSGPIAGAWVLVDEIINTTTSPRFRDATRTDSHGRYRFRLPSGSYLLRSEASHDLDLIAPTPITVAILPGASVVKNLTYRNADAEIAGTVFLSDVAHSALVWGYSEKGGRSWSLTRNGNFRLPASTNETWYIGAVAEDGQLAFRTGPIVVPITTTNPPTQALNLTFWQKLPEGQSVSFDASAMQIVTLSDGTEIQIPAGAMALTGTVTVRATPKAMLVRDQARRPIGLAYVLAALDSDGHSISTFNQNVNIVIPYTDEQLSSLGLTEDDLVPSYWDEVTGTWQKVDNVLVDRVNKKVTLIVDHFTDFALGGSPAVLGTALSSVYLPVLYKSFTSGW